jgi:parallel beta-helix repeat protein
MEQTMAGFASFVVLGLFVAASMASRSAWGQTASSAATRTADIRDFGSVADGKTLNTAAIQKAIDTLAQRGGGTLVIPAGEKPVAGQDAERAGAFLSGALFLKPGVNVRVEKDAILKGSTDTKDYPMTRTRIEGHFQDWLPGLLNAEGTDHLRIEGDGTLDGSGTPFYAAFRAAMARDRSTRNLDVPRPRLIVISRCKDVQVSGIRLLNSGFWNLHMYNCDNVVIDGLDIRAPAGSPSTDGIDVDSSRNVLVKNTFISNNDDCIALKGSKGVFARDDQDSPPVEHVRVTNCTFAMGGSLVTCGSEATVVRDVRVENCTIAGPESRGINMLRLKLRTDTPQVYEDIHFNDITLDGAGTLVNVSSWAQYEDLQGQPRPTHTVRNISISNVKGTFGSFGTIGPQAQDTVENITLENIKVRLTGNANPNFRGIRKMVVRNVNINDSEYVPSAAFSQGAMAPSTNP